MRVLYKTRYAQEIDRDIPVVYRIYVSSNWMYKGEELKGEFAVINKYVTDAQFVKNVDLKKKTQSIVDVVPLVCNKFEF